MNDCPAILIEFDPETWEIVAVVFKADTDQQTDALKAFLAEGMRTATQTKGGPTYVS